MISFFLPNPTTRRHTHFGWHPVVVGAMASTGDVGTLIDEDVAALVVGRALDLVDSDGSMEWKASQFRQLMHRLSRPGLVGLVLGKPETEMFSPVSYTHLTLPTILRV